MPEFKGQPEDIQISELNKLATRAKEQGDWDSAIRYLVEAQTLMLNNPSTEFVQLLRLPMFMQQGGYYQDAMIEFIRVQSCIDNFVQLSVSDTWPDYVQKAKGDYMAGLCMEKLYDKMRLSAKRAKKTEDHDRFLAMHDKAKTECATLKQKADDAHDEYMGEIKARRDERRKRIRPKSRLLGLLLTLCTGPLGLFYSNKNWGIAGIIALLLSVIFLPIAFLIVWFASVYISDNAIIKHNTNL